MTLGNDKVLQFEKPSEEEVPGKTSPAPALIRFTPSFDVLMPKATSTLDSTARPPIHILEYKNCTLSFSSSNCVADFNETT